MRVESWYLLERKIEEQWIIDTKADDFRTVLKIIRIFLVNPFAMAIEKKNFSKNGQLKIQSGCREENVLMIKLGYAETNITPDIPLQLVGFNRMDKTSKGILKPLHLTIGFPCPL